MARGFAAGMSVGRLRGVLLALFVLLAVPAIALVVQTQRQLRWESYHQYGTLAGELALRIDAELQRLVAVEEARGYGDYAFYTVEGSPQTQNQVQRSSLSDPAATADLPGALGWFQIDAEGRFSTPLLPPATEDPAVAGLDPAEVASRRASSDRLRAILAAGGSGVAIDEATEATARGDASPRDDANAIDALAGAAKESKRPPGNALGRVDDLAFDTRYQVANIEREAQSASRLLQQRQKVNPSSRALRKEQSAEAVQIDVDPAARVDATRVRWFESELDPFQFRPLDAQHALLFRRVWRDGRRGLQGVVLDTQRFLQQVAVDAFAGSALAADTDFVIALDGDVLRLVAAEATSGDAGRGELLHEVRLSAPFDDLQLLWSARALPAGPGARLVGWTAAILLAAIAAGLLALYRLGLRQLALTAQQRDFVAAVSHELKTPLTSIRMYAEVLRAGWASAEKQREYYDFIHDESERLSRLIGNVLQLARLERDGLALDPRVTSVAALFDLARSRLQAQVERAGFEGDFHLDPDLVAREVEVDVDAFVQIVINLADNALKFAARADRRRLELSVCAAPRGQVGFALRDFGPGIPATQLPRIFLPFQRGGSELTREAPGTGIGLALARQLARAMHGDLDYRPATPGAEFHLRLPLRAATAIADPVSPASADGR